MARREVAAFAVKKASATKALLEAAQAFCAAEVVLRSVAGEGVPRMTVLSEASAGAARRREGMSHKGRKERKGERREAGFRFMAGTFSWG